MIGRQENVLALPNSAIKTQQEATQLARALGLDVDVAALAREAASAGERPSEAAGAPGGETDEEVINGVPVSRLASMSQDERRTWFGGLSPAERTRAFQLFREQRERQSNAPPTAGPRPAFVFRYDEAGALTLKPIMIGLSNFDYTEVVSGVEEGEQVVSVPLSLIQQQDLLNRIRSRTSLPGIGGGR